MDQAEADLKRCPTISVCGLDCGLCPRYYTAGPSRYPGCGGPNFPNKHPSCSFITCCVKKLGLDVCAQCSDFPCSKFKSDEEYQQLNDSTSYASPKRIMPNQRYIKEHGKQFIEQQQRRIQLLEAMLGSIDDGRSKSFYCRAATLLDLRALEDSLTRAAQATGASAGGSDDYKARAGILREILCEAALTCGIELSKRK